MLRQVTSLPPHSVVVNLHVIVDAAGVAVDHDQAMQGLRQASNSPIFGCYETSSVRGSSGAGSYRIRSLGLSSCTNRGSHSPRRRCIPDLDATHEALYRRSSMGENCSDGESARAAACQRQHRPLRPRSLWEAYRWQMLGIGGLVLLQSLLIAGLFAQRSRRGGARTGPGRQRKKTAADYQFAAGADRLRRSGSTITSSTTRRFIVGLESTPDAVRGRTMWDVLGERLYGLIRRTSSGHWLGNK